MATSRNRENSFESHGPEGIDLPGSRCDECPKLWSAHLYVEAADLGGPPTLRARAMLVLDVVGGAPKSQELSATANWARSRFFYRAPTRVP